MKDDALREKLSPREKIMKMLTITKSDTKESSHSPRTPRSPQTEKEKSPRQEQQKSPKEITIDRGEVNKSPFKDKNRPRSKTEATSGEKKSNSLPIETKSMSYLLSFLHFFLKFSFISLSFLSHFFIDELNSIKNQKAAQWRLSKRDSTQPKEKNEAEPTLNLYSSVCNIKKEKMMSKQ